MYNYNFVAFKGLFSAVWNCPTYTPPSGESVPGWWFFKSVFQFSKLLAFFFGKIYESVALDWAQEIKQFLKNEISFCSAFFPAVTLTLSASLGLHFSFLLLRTIVAASTCKASYQDKESKRSNWTSHGLGAMAPVIREKVPIPLSLRQLPDHQGSSCFPVTTTTQQSLLAEVREKKEGGEGKGWGRERERERKEKEKKIEVSPLCLTIRFSIFLFTGPENEIPLEHFLSARF